MLDLDGVRDGISMRIPLVGPRTVEILKTVAHSEVTVESKD